MNDGLWRFHNLCDVFIFLDSVEAWAHFAPVGLVCAPDVTVAHDLSRWELLFELVE